MDTIVIGIDGGELSIVNDLLSKEELPNIRELINQGIKSKLQSTTPPVSPLAWNTIYTGTNPGKHGIFDFSSVDKNYSKKPSNAEKRSIEPFWQVLNDTGISTGLFNLPFTYPAKSVDGFIVNGWPLPSTVHDFAHPDEIIEEIGSLNRILVNKGFDEGDYSKLKEELFQTVENQVNILSSILESNDPDFLFTVFDGLDVAQHFFWKFQDTEHPRFTSHPEYSDVISDYYKYIDRFIGGLQKNTVGEFDIILISDHGFQKLHSEIHIDEWLNRNGYLSWSEQTLSSRTSKFASRCLELTWKYIGKVGLDDLVSRIVPEQSIQKAREMASTERPIDYSSTSAFFSGVSGQSIYINKRKFFNKGQVGQKEYNDLIAELSDSLRRLEDPETGDRIIHAVYNRDEIYNGGRVQNAPDIILEYNEGYSLKGGISESIKTPSSAVEYDRSGDHKKTGLFIASGPSFMPETKVCMSVEDIAPLLLHINDAPVPRIMDGGVPKGLLSNDKKDIQYTSGYYQDNIATNGWTRTESEEIEDQLKDLGYMK